MRSDYIYITLLLHPDTQGISNENISLFVFDPKHPSIALVRLIWVAGSDRITQDLLHSLPYSGFMQELARSIFSYKRFDQQFFFEFELSGNSQYKNKKRSRN